MKKSVLIFDDDEEIVSICSFLLKRNGWEVNSFSNVVSVVEKTASVNPSVIIMDNWIPEYGGIQATHLLKQSAKYKNIPVVYFSANSQVAELAALAGADSYLAKPFQMNELIDAVDHALTLVK